MKAFRKKNRPLPIVRGRQIFLIFYLWLIPFFWVATNLHAATVTEGVKRYKLDNGFTVLLKENHASPVAAIQIWVRTGSANETEKEAGITHFIEHMIFKGTPTRKMGEIARTIESSGGNINAYTSLDRTVYYVEIAGPHFYTGLEVLLDAVQHSLFDAKEVKKEKEVVLEEYRRSLDNPRRQLGKALMSLSYKKHPYRRPVIGYESTIRSYSRETILKYIDKWYTPQNMVLAAVGDFNEGQAIKEIRALTRDFPKRKGKRPFRPEEPKQTDLRTTILKDDVQQVYLDLSWHIPALADPHIPALDILETILSHGKSSRLYARLKMKENLVHSISAGSYALLDPGLFSIDSTLKPEKTKMVLKAIAEEVVRISTVPVSEPELQRAKAISEADFLFAMEKMSGQARTLAFFQTMMGDLYEVDAYLKKLQEVTSKEIMDVAGAYLGPHNLSIGLMAPNGSDIKLSEQDLIAAFSIPSGKRNETKEERNKSNVKATKITLGKGMRVIIKENHHLPVVSITGGFLGGVRLEGNREWGISGFVSEMLTRGTKERSASEIASAVDGLAGQLNGFSGKNSFGISAKFLSKDLFRGLELIADLLLNPIFPEPEIEKVREDILANIRAKKDRPTPQLFDLFYKTLFKKHPYGHPETGTEETIRAIRQKDLVDWRRRLAVPSNFVLTVVGDVKKERLLPYLKKLFGDFALLSSPGPAPVIAEAALAKPRKAHVERPGAQTHLVIGYIGADFKSRDNAPMALIDTALSGQGGRLFHQLRDRESLAYVVSAFRRPGLETGLFGVYIASDPSKASAAKKGIFRELNKVRKEGLTEKELADAKKYLLGNLRIGLQTNGNQALQMTLDELYSLGYDYRDKYIEEIKAVTLEDIKQAARKIIGPENYVFVTLGPELEKE